MKIYTTILCVIFAFQMSLFAQKKVMDQSAYCEWKSIKSQMISKDGNWVKYHIAPGKGDNTLVLYNVSNSEERTFARVKKSQFSEDGRFLVFTIGPAQDSVRYKKRRKVDKKDMPGDSLVLVNLESGVERLIPHVKSFKLPTKWSGILAYEVELEITPQDTSKKSKKEDFLIIQDLISGKEDSIKKVDKYIIAEEGPSILLHRNGKDSSDMPGVFVYDTKNGKKDTLISQAGKYKNAAIDKAGLQVAFIADLDTTDRRIRPYDLYLWTNGALERLLGSDQKLTANEYFLSEHSKAVFSESGNRLYFGIGEKPVLADSLALDSDLVQVEVWTTEDPMLYTMQELRKDDLIKETFQQMYDLKSKEFVNLETFDRKYLTKSLKGDGRYAMVSNSTPYMKALTWEGRSAFDYYLVDLEDKGQQTLIEKQVYADISFSPGGKYAYWFDRDQLDWYAYDLETRKKINMSKNIPTSVVNEIHDSPSKPRQYGSGGWAVDDAFFLIYDRFDVWKVDPKGGNIPQNLTKGRDKALQSRIIDLDRENDFLDPNPMLLLFNEESKESGYGRLNLDEYSIKELVLEPYSFSRRPLKSKDADKLMFTKESFERFPDLIVTDLEFEDQKQISNVNPQQKEYRWGSIEIFKWTDYKGNEVEGLLVKPEGFDPLQKYPVIVNFYEKSSSGLHRHRAPEPHRSTINYSYYANKGYVIFNPDVAYEIGDPGASAYNAVISGVEALSKNQYIDKERIGVQGHSWGGYQIAHLLNKTDLFRCAESGAPVVNMVSAYGGIRWGSGMSRMFQYEKTQSRLGASLWEDKEAYLRNSPIFELPQMNTPVLILHNDNDGAVPWYQGIEYYMALRRLGKPAWFLNYNGEPHWPLKWENRLDFNKRMEQFFAHYLLDAPMPNWMKNGVSVKNKGINQGFETEE